MREEEGDDNDESTVKPSRSFRSASLLEEASRRHFGAILEAFLALLGPSWGPLGALWGGLGGLLGPSWAPPDHLRPEGWWDCSVLQGHCRVSWSPLGALWGGLGGLLCGFTDTVDTPDVNNDNCRDVVLGVDVSNVRSVDLISFSSTGGPLSRSRPAPATNSSRARELALCSIDMCINMNT